MRKMFTQADVAHVREHYADTPTVAIASALNRTLTSIYQLAARLGLHKSEAFRASDLAGRIQRGRTDPRSVATQLKPGNVPWNKGKPGSCGLHPNSRRTQFKKGRPAHEARNYLPIGSERICKDGYCERKVTDDPSIVPARRWVSVHRLVWIAAHGPIPSEHIVAFKRGMHTPIATEITIDRLELITRVENMRRNTLHNLPAPLPQLIQLRGVLVRKINRRARAHEKQD